MTSESVEGATPNGGVRSTAFYLDDNGQPAEKDKATAMRIVEYNDSGAEVFRTYGRLDSDDDEENEDGEIGSENEGAE